MHMKLINSLKLIAISTISLVSAIPIMADISVSIASMPLRRAMKEIEKVSDLHFIYKSGLPELNINVSLSVKMLLKGIPLTNYSRERVFPTI